MEFHPGLAVQDLLQVPSTGFDRTSISVDDVAFSCSFRKGGVCSSASMPMSRSSRAGSSDSRFGSVGITACDGGHGWDVKSSKILRSLTSCPEQLIQLSSFVHAQAIRFVWRDSSQVFSGTKACPSTKPHRPAPTVRPDQGSRSKISSSHCHFRSFAWVVSAEETE